MAAGLVEAEPGVVVVGTGSAGGLAAAGGPPVPVGPLVVAVAEGTELADPADVRWADVALTTAAEPPPPWVQVDDLGAAIDELTARMGSAPGPGAAAAVFLQVLRLGESLPVEAGLVLESLSYSMLQAGPAFTAWRSTRAVRPPRPVREPELLVERRDDRLALALNRPQVHNAYNRRIRDLLCSALTVAVADPDCRVELTGRGPSFCSGGDLDEFGTAPDPVTAHSVRITRSPARLLALLSGRTTAFLHGACAGSGIELPAFAGRVVARPDARIWLPELAMGLIPGAGGTVSLPRRMGRHRTAWLGLTGRAIDAVRATEWGLVDELAD